MIYYYQPTDEFIVINHKFNICEIITHEELDRLEMMKDRNHPFGEYELRQMFPTHFPRQRHAFSNNKITDQDIQNAKSVPIKNFLKVNSNGFAQCLFHDDKNASMKIYPKNYHCFSCNAHGTVVDIVMKLHNVTFKEAIMIAIEVDGGSHCSLARKEQDKRKEDFLIKKGWTVFRFKNKEVMSKLENVLKQINVKII